MKTTIYYELRSNEGLIIKKYVNYEDIKAYQEELLKHDFWAKGGVRIFHITIKEEEIK